MSRNSGRRSDAYISMWVWLILTVIYYMKRFLQWIGNHRPTSCTLVVQRFPSTDTAIKTFISLSEITVDMSLGLFVSVVERICFQFIECLITRLDQGKVHNFTGKHKFNVCLVCVWSWLHHTLRPSKPDCSVFLQVKHILYLFQWKNVRISKTLISHGYRNPLNQITFKLNCC